MGVGVDGRGGARLAGRGDEPQHLLGARVEVGRVEAARPHGVDEPARRAQAGRRHLEGATGRRGGDDVVRAAPVGDDGAVEPPLPAQDLGEEERVLVGVDAVDEVVRRHDRPGPGLRDDDPERREVDLPERALVDHGVRDHATQLLGVHREVLGARGDAVGLDPAHVAGGHPAREQRVLGEVLEVAPAERRALDVEARAEQHVHVLRRGLGAERGAHALGQLDVPRVRHGGRRREARGLLRGRDAEVVGGAELLADAVRAVGQPEGADAEPREVVRLPHGLPRQQGRLLQERQARGRDDGGRRPRGRGRLAGRGGGLAVELHGALLAWSWGRAGCVGAVPGRPGPAVGGCAADGDWSDVRGGGPVPDGGPGPGVGPAVVGATGPTAPGAGSPGRSPAREARWSPATGRRGPPARRRVRRPPRPPTGADGRAGPRGRRRPGRAARAGRTRRSGRRPRWAACT